VPSLSVIVVTYNSEAEISACLRSLLPEVEGIRHEILVVDNNSSDRTVADVRRLFPGVTLLVNQENAGFPRANNQAIVRSTGDHVLLLNPDTIVPPEAIRTLMTRLDAEEGLGVCGPRLIDEAGVPAPDIRLPTLSRVALDVLFGLARWYDRRDRRVIVSGAAMLIKRKVLDDIGLLDEEMFWREDVDYCLRALKAGYAVRVVTEATIIHIGGRSAASNLEVALERPLSSSILFFMKHYGRMSALIVAGLLWWQTLLRFVKWKAKAAVRPTPESRQRLTAFAHILRRFPEFVRKAQQVYQPGG
jgi:N-acetylglucosaminyl-diphospho-decaprenol L-rhamnosyltransferase